jgi:predicted nucleic acid-binding Zn ribbon protein
VKTRTAPAAPVGPSRPCAWCGGPIHGPRQRRFCSRKCRQTAFRLRHREGVAIEVEDHSDRRPLRFLYRDVVALGADVPNDLARELARYDGWALSAAPAALPELLAKLRGGPVICAWHSPISAAEGEGLRASWEALIVKTTRAPRPVTDSFFAGLRADASEGRPAAFGAWVVSVLGLLPGDRVADLGADRIVGRAWRELGGGAAGDMDPLPPPRARPRRRPAAPELAPELAAEVGRKDTLEEAPGLPADGGPADAAAAGE